MENLKIDSIAKAKLLQKIQGFNDDVANIKTK